MRIYIAGPMTGIPNYNHDAFVKSMMYWRSLGHIVTTPFEATQRVWRRNLARPFDPAKDQCDPGHPLFRELIEEDMKLLLAADTIVLLRDWIRSRGARLELAVALGMGMRVIDDHTGYELSLDYKLEFFQAGPVSREDASPSTDLSSRSTQL